MIIIDRAIYRIKYCILSQESWASGHARNLGPPNFEALVVAIIVTRTTSIAVRENISEYDTATLKAVCYKPCSACEGYRSVLRTGTAKPVIDDAQTR